MVECKKNCPIIGQKLTKGKDMKKVFGWIFAVLSLALLVVFVVFLVLHFKGADLGLDETFINEHSVVVFGMSLIATVGCGFVSHLFMVFAEEKGFPYYATFPMYGIVLAIYYLVMGIKFLFLKLMGSDATFDDVCLNLHDKSFNKTSSYNGANKGGASGGSSVVYTVTENGYRRTLTLFQSYCRDYEAPEGKEFGAYYNKFKDDIGHYWRSYDGNKTFISETELRNGGWKIPW